MTTEFKTIKPVSKRGSVPLLLTLLSAVVLGVIGFFGYHFWLDRTPSGVVGLLAKDELFSTWKKKYPEDYAELLQEIEKVLPRDEAGAVLLVDSLVLAKAGVRITPLVAYADDDAIFAFTGFMRDQYKALSEISAIQCSLYIAGDTTEFDERLLKVISDQNPALADTRRNQVYYGIISTADTMRPMPDTETFNAVSEKVLQAEVVESTLKVLEESSEIERVCKLTVSIFDGLLTLPKDHVAAYMRYALRQKSSLNTSTVHTTASP